MAITAPAAFGDWTGKGPRGRNRLLISSGLQITTFGEDAAGEIYVAGTNGAVLHIVGSAAPRFYAANVVNAASFVKGLTPGSLATVFAAGVRDDPGTVVADRVPLPFVLGDVSITVNGIAAPIYAVVNRNGLEQVNFQVPFDAADRTTAPVIITRGGQSSAAVSVAVTDILPGIYTSDGSQAVVVHNADYSLVTTSRPLQRGEFAFLYAAGIGPVNNQPATGSSGPITPLASTKNSVNVSLGGRACEVQYSGLAPGLVGVYQVNFRVPSDVPSGVEDLILSVGTAASPTVKAPIR